MPEQLPSGVEPEVPINQRALFELFLGLSLQRWERIASFCEGFQNLLKQFVRKNWAGRRNGFCEVRVDHGEEQGGSEEK